MKITFDSQSLNTVENSTITYKTNTLASVSGKVSAYDIGSALGENNTYEGKKQSVKDFQDSLKNKDVSVAQDYMTVLSHTVSQKDFNHMVKEGIDFSSADSKDIVTIVDKIKLYVAKGGADIKGFTDTLSSDTIEAMTGSRAIDPTKDSLDVPEYDITLNGDELKDIHEAYEEISEVNEMTDGMKKYLLGLDSVFSIHDIYLAKHSAVSQTKSQGSGYFNVETPGYLVKKADEESDACLADKVANLLENIGEEVNDNTVSQGMWLVKNSLMITSSNIHMLNDIDSVSLPVTKEDFSKAVLIAVTEGKSPKEASLLKVDNIYEEAVRITDEFEALLSSEAVTKTRVLEETRLKMTYEANLLLLKSNVKIDTKDLEAYVEALKQIENTNEYKEAKELTLVENLVKDVKELPAAIIPSFAKNIDNVTLPEIKEVSKTLVSFDHATKAYEEVGTQVRKDLGDSIKKAFRNVDDILNDLDIAVSNETRRAVRILGYNSMAINKESIKEISEADAKLQSVLKRLTPQDTLTLIRKGSSPVNMSIKELNDFLDSQKDTSKEDIEKYSKFLYKLECEKGISNEERKAYIDVYRLIHQIEKGDMAAVGSVINAGMELTLGNLKTAVKTAKSKGMDISIDSSYGFLVSDIKNEMDASKLVKTTISDETTLNDLYSNLLEVSAEDIYEENWNQEKYKELMSALKAPEEVVTELIMNNVPVTPEHLESAYELMKNRGKAFKNVNSSENDNSEVIRKEESFIEAFSDKESAKEAYAEMIDEAKENVYESAFLKESYIDVRELRLTHLELSLARNYSESETYEVPVTIGGENTSVNLKIVHNSLEEPNVLVVMETERFGRISARLSVKNDEINGYISCNSKETVTKMQEVADTLGNRVLAVYAEKSDTDQTLSKTPMRNNDESISSSMLYDTAKRFLEAVKGIN